MPDVGNPIHALIPLTPREREVMELYAQGLLRKQIAAQLQISESAVKKHAHRVLTKTLASSMRQAIWLRKPDAAPSSRAKESLRNPGEEL